MVTSKVILLVNYIFGVVLTTLTVIGVIRGYDVTALGIVTGAVFAEISVSNAFYYNKAKRENAIKIALDCVKKMPDKFEGNTDVASLLMAIKD